MIEFDIRNGVLYGANNQKGESKMIVPDNVRRIKSLNIEFDIEELTISENVEIIDLDAFSIGTNLRTIICNSKHFIIYNHMLMNKEKTIVYLTERLLKRKIVLPLSIRKISAYAFAHCSYIESISMHNSIDYIGTLAFSECYNIKQISIPSTYEFELKEGTFESCTALESIIIPNNIIKLGECLFYECWNLKSVLIQNNKIKEIPRECFEYCETLENVELCKSITSIEDRAFYGCECLAKLNIPKSVNKIGTEVFGECLNLIISSESSYVLKYCRYNNIKSRN